LETVTTYRIPYYT